MLRNQHDQLIDELAQSRQWFQAIYRGAVDDITRINVPASRLLGSDHGFPEAQRWKLLADLAAMGQNAQRRMALSEQSFDECRRAARHLNDGNADKLQWAVKAIAENRRLIEEEMGKTADLQLIWEAEDW